MRVNKSNCFGLFFNEKSCTECSFWVFVLTLFFGGLIKKRSHVIRRNCEWDSRGDFHGVYADHFAILMKTKAWITCDSRTNRLRQCIMWLQVIKNRELGFNSVTFSSHHTKSLYPHFSVQIRTWNLLWQEKKKEVKPFCNIRIYVYIWLWTSDILWTQLNRSRCVRKSSLILSQHTEQFWSTIKGQ